MLLFLKNALFALVVPGLLAGWVPLEFFEHDPQWPAHGWQWQHWAGLALFLTGTLAYIHCAWLFASYGHGTPAPFDPPRKLVQRGLYRWVRNPMYLSFLLLVAGEAVFLLSWHIAVYLLVMACASQLVVMLHEESQLLFDFGAMYEDYRRDVPRWWPRRPRPRE